MKIKGSHRLTGLLLSIAAYCTNPAVAQDAHLIKQLQQSNYLSVIMKADSANMGMTRWLKKPVEKSRVLPLLPISIP